MKKLREFWIQWYPAGHYGPEDSIQYPAVCVQKFKSVTAGEMIHVREVTPIQETIKRTIGGLLLQVRMGETVDERVLASEQIENIFVDAFNAFQAITEDSTVDCLNCKSHEAIANKWLKEHQ